MWTISFDSHLILMTVENQKTTINNKLEQWNKYACSILSSKTSWYGVTVKAKG